MGMFNDKIDGAEVKKGAMKALKKAPKGLLSAGFIGYRTSSYMEEGHSFLGGLGRTAAWYSMVGAVGFKKYLGYSMAKGAMGAYPDMKRGIEEQKDFSQNYNFLGGGYVDTETNYANRARGMEQIKRNRVSITQSLGNEAKRYHK